MTAERPYSRNYRLTLYFAAACAVYNLKMDKLRASNTEGLLRFVDISNPAFDPASLGVSLQALNGLLRAQRPDGSLVVGVKVFWLAYGAVGLGRWTVPTQWRLVARCWNAWRNRLRREPRPALKASAAQQQETGYEHHRRQCGRRID